MKTKDYYLDIWTSWVWSYNSCYEDKLDHCPMIDEPEESLNLLESYCKIIITEGKRIQKNKLPKSYENYSLALQSAIQSIIKLLSDGRDMHLTVDVSHLGKPLNKYNHHLQSNGLLPFENDPFDICKRLLDDIPEVQEIIESEKATANFEQFYNDKWYFFEGYENGSMAIKFSKINKNQNAEYTFDGDIICYETVNGRCEGDGIILQKDVTDVPFNEIPYCDIDDWDDEEDSIENQLIEFIEIEHEWHDKITYRKVLTDEEMHKDVMENMEALLDQTFGI